MKRFLYFLPGRRAMSLDDVIDAGLGYVFDKKGGFGLLELLGAGPDGGPGAIVGLPSSPAHERGERDVIAYHPDAQTWTPLVSGAEIWIGCDKDARP